MIDLKYQQLLQARDRALSGDRKSLARAEKDLKMYVASKLVQETSKNKTNWEYDPVILEKDMGIAYFIHKTTKTWKTAQFMTKTVQDADYLVALLNLTSGKTPDRMAQVLSRQTIALSEVA